MNGSCCRLWNFKKSIQIFGLVLLYEQYGKDLYKLLSLYFQLKLTIYQQVNTPMFENEINSEMIVLLNTTNLFSRY